MGHTNYWLRPVKLPPKSFHRAVVDCLRLLPKLDIPLAGAWGTGKPKFGPTVIVFNGITGQFHETFRIEQESSSRRDGPTIMEFCKTAQLPYDLAVQVTLIIFKHHIGASFQVSSDRGADWANAQRICQQHLGYGEDFQLDPN